MMTKHACGREARFRRVRRLAVQVAAAAVAASLAACGGGSPSGPSGPTRTVIGTQNGSAAALTAQFHPLTANASGTYDLTLDWGNASNDFDLFVTSNLCSPSSLFDLEAGNGDCRHVTSSRSTTAKPERVSWAGTANITYRAWVANFSLSADSYTLTFGVTR